MLLLIELYYASKACRMMLCSILFCIYNCNCHVSLSDRYSPQKSLGRWYDADLSDKKQIQGLSTYIGKCLKLPNQFKRGV